MKSVKVYCLKRRNNMQYAAEILKRWQTVAILRQIRPIPIQVLSYRPSACKESCTLTIWQPEWL